MSAHDPAPAELREAAPALIASMDGMVEVCANQVACVIAAGGIVDALTKIHGMTLDDAIDAVRQCVLKTQGKLREGMQ